MSSSGCWKRFWPDRSFCARLVQLILALALAWQTPAPALAQSTCGSYAVAVAPQTVGHPLPGDLVRIVDAGSDVTIAEFEQPRTVLASPRDGVALLRSLQGLTSLLDVATGTVTPLQIPTGNQISLEVSTPFIRNAERSNFMVLADPLNTVWLIDLTSGDALDLSVVISQPDSVSSAVFSPDGTLLLFYRSGAAYLLSLDSSGQPQLLDPTQVLPGADFDSDGSAVLYATKGANDIVTVRSFDLTSGTRKDVASAPGIRLIDLNDGGPLLASTDKSILALQRGATAFSPIFQWSGEPIGVTHDSGGRHLLAGDRSDGVASYFWIDTQGGETRELPELKGMLPLLLDSAAQNTVLFGPAGPHEPGSPGAPYQLVDMATGQTVVPLAQDSTEIWTASLAGDRQGRYALINAVSPGSGRLWLIDLEQGSAALIGSSAGNLTASISPDGCQLATSIFDTIGEGRTSAVSVTSMLDGSPIVSIPNAVLLGWSEIAP